MFCSLKVKQCVDFLHASRHSEELLTLPPYAPSAMRRRGLFSIDLDILKTEVLLFWLKCTVVLNQK